MNFFLMVNWVRTIIQHYIINLNSLEFSFFILQQLHLEHQEFLIIINCIIADFNKQFSLTVINNYYHYT